MIEKVRTYKIYSIELRQEVIDFIEQGSSYGVAAQKFGIQKPIIGRWYKKYKLGEGIAPKQAGRKAKLELNQLVKVIEEYPNATFKELGEKLNVSGICVSRYIKEFKLNHKRSYKKDLIVKTSKRKYGRWEDEFFTPTAFWY